MIELADIETILLGVYIIAHGGIHLIFLGNFKDEKTNIFTGWSKKSWLLDKFMNVQEVKITGFITWITIAILFGLSGLIILDIVHLSTYLSAIIILASIIGILAYVIFYNGFQPTPYHWILGVVINGLIILFYGLFIESLSILLVLLLIVWAYGMTFHTKLLKAFQIQN